MTRKSLKFGAIATGDRHTTEAAAEILQDGGNAFDAALAGLACACLSEPVLASLGAGGYLLAAPESGRPILYDFFVQTPLVKRPGGELDFSAIDVDFGPDTQEFHIGYGAIATPGVVKAMAEISQNHGRLPLTRIFEPAITRARQGVGIGPIQTDVLRYAEPIMRADPAMEALITRGEDKRLLEPGDTIAWPAFANVLDALAHEGPRLFYEGEIAAAIVEQTQAGGGHLTMADLKSYQVEFRKPLELSFHGWTVAINPPPSAGGVLIGMMLALLEAGGPLPSRPEPDRYERLAQAMWLTNKARREVPSNHPDDIARLLDPELLATYRREILPAPQAVRGTTHIGVTDANGNAVALTVSNGEGCGRMGPFGGFMLNNMLGEEDLNPTGFHSWPTDTRLSSMMAPGIAQAPDGRRISFGSGGSNRIRTAIAQVLVNLIDGDMPLEDAIAAPRLHLEPDMLHIEGGIDQEMIDRPERFADGHRFWPDISFFFGGVHLAACDTAGRGDVAADERRGGSTWCV